MKLPLYLGFFKMRNIMAAIKDIPPVIRAKYFVIINQAKRAMAPSCSLFPRVEIKRIMAAQTATIKMEINRFQYLVFSAKLKWI